MRRKLCFVLCLVFVSLAGLAVAKEVDKNYSFGGDVRFRAFYREFERDFFEDQKGSQDLYQIRARVWGTLGLLEDMVKLHGQIRGPYWFGDEDYADYLNDSRLKVDLLYVQLCRIFDWPFEITLGKQELLYGEGFLTGNRDVFRDNINDEPENFTAVKVRYLRDQLTVDAFYSRIEEAHGGESNLGRNDFAGLVARYEFTPEKTVEPYLFFDDDATRKLHNHPNRDRVWVAGCRVTTPAFENLYLKAEGCYQWGEFNNVFLPDDEADFRYRDYKAWGGYAGAEYRFPVEYNPSLAFTVIGVSGEEYPDSGDYNSFHPLFRSENFGELHTKYTEDNKIIYRTTFKCEPTEKLDVLLEWFDYRAIDSTTGTGRPGEGKHDGDEIDLRFNYELNDHVSFSLFAGWFKPGDYWPGVVVTREGGQDLTLEVMGEMLVKF